MPGKGAQHRKHERRILEGYIQLQLFGDYDEGWDLLALDSAFPYGFDDADRRYDALTDAWRRALTLEGGS